MSLTHTMLLEELWLEVFSYLGFRDLQEVGLVSYDWRQLAVLSLKKKSLLHLEKENLSNVADYLRETEDVSATYSFSCWGLTIENMYADDCVHNLQYILTLIGRHVRKLYIYNSPSVASLEKYLPNVESLHLNVLDDLNIHAFPKLKAFCVNDINRESTEESLQYRKIIDLHRFVELEELQIYFLIRNDADAMQIVEPHAPYLKKLNISVMLPECDLQKWGLLWQKFRKLQSMEVIMHTLKRDDYFESMVNNLSADLPLKVLDFPSCSKHEFTKSPNLYRRYLKKWENKFRTMRLLHFATVEEQIALQCNLRELIVCKDVFTENDIFVISRNLPNLRRLYMDNCTNGVTDASLACLFKHQTGLRSLRISDCLNVTDDGLCGFGTEPAGIHRLRGLRFLDLSGCNKITDRTLRTALKFSELKILDISSSPYIMQEGVGVLLQRCPALEHLKVPISVV